MSESEFSEMNEPSPMGSAIDEPKPSPREPEMTPAASRSCEVKGKVNAIRIRTGPDANSTGLGHLNAGQTLPASCTAVRGGIYTACGHNTNVWIPVQYGGRTAYVVRACVEWYYVSSAAQQPVEAEAFGVG